MITAYFDGACVPNADFGRIAYGAVIKRDEEIIHETSQRYNRYGIITNNIASNNIAEYCGCIAVLSYLLHENLYAEETYIFGDSKLVIMQMRGDWKASDGKYLPFYNRAITYLKSFHSPPFFEWIPRERNVYADALAKRALRD